MRVLYSSAGEASLLYSEHARSLPEVEVVASCTERLHAQASCPRKADIDRIGDKEIRLLAARCEPSVFLTLRKLSVPLLAFYKEKNEGVKRESIPKRVCVRFGEDVCAEEMLAAGICVKSCGVRDVVFSLPKGALSPMGANACRLCGISEVWLCGGVEAVGAAAFGGRGEGPCDLLLGRGDREFEVSAGLVSQFTRVRVTDSRWSTASVLLLLDGADTELMRSDAELLSERFPTRQMLLISKDKNALLSLGEITDRDRVTLLVTSSDEESLAVAGNLALPTYEYGDGVSEPLTLREAQDPIKVFRFDPSDI